MMGQVLQYANDLHNKAMAADEWQARAELAELRANGLEQERARLQARVDKLQQGLKDIYAIAQDLRVEMLASKTLGHKTSCDFMLDGACTCGGVTDGNKATKGQGDHYPKEKAVSE